MQRGTLYVKAGGEDIPVARCTVELTDGGVFVTEETEHGKATMTWRRIGTLSAETRHEIREARDAC